ncbi:MULTISPECIES: hypothetical protein [Vibrio]|uniref:hypothetical protein n=1 Tax=Vibrio TaxID=662 RepID=UPI00211A0E42|nr:MULTISPECIES: hypothetical protein [Vibrio]MCQ9039845.1 hypothetical protein [Vibrio alginolyticus]MDK9744554.1 hypothetical protein [Vibrio sp. B516a]MDU9596060.1 hypothetical protein [Vibrio sp. 2-1-2a]MDU9605308.1 hypothetical protein [Vibrio sp. 1-2-3a]
MAVESTESFQYMSEMMGVLQTLAGAGIAFGAAYFTTKYTKDRESLLALSARERERIERIYYLLVLVRKDVLEDSQQCISHINFNTKYQVRDVRDFPPLLELEMLVELYFPVLDEYLTALKSSVANFTNKKIGFLSNSYESALEPLKKKDSGEIVRLTMKFSETHKQFQAKLKELAKV